jgi:SOS-response transcriptional repressor LexA
MATLPLTPKQEKLWRFIASCDSSPSYVEMCAAVGTKSVGSVFVMLERLEERGFIRRIPGKHRSIVAVNDAEVLPSLARFDDADLIAELERRSNAANSRPIAIRTPPKHDETPAMGDWRDRARNGSKMLLAAIQSAGLVAA